MVPRFMREYASYQRKAIARNELMREDTKAEMVRSIDKTVQLYERRMITVEEAMSLISKPRFTERGHSSDAL